MARLAWCSLALLCGCTPIAPLEYDAGPNDGRADAGWDAAGPDAGADAGCGALDVCDGVDNDCDATTVDGSDDPAFGSACDGVDADQCPEGGLVCSSGELFCEDTTGDSIEACDGVDNDCDTRIDEDGATGSIAFYPDVDMDGHGDDAGVRMACEAPTPGTWLREAGDCDDADPAIGPGAPERCNARDDDCDAMIDEGSPCRSCDTRTYMGHTYLICEDDETWVLARTECESYGYHLVVIDDAAENEFLVEQADRFGFGFRGAWVGLSDRALEGDFTWVDGSLPTYSNWEPGEPDEADDDCVRVRRAALGGGWVAWRCSEPAEYICEAP